MIFGNINALGNEKKYPTIILEYLHQLKNGNWNNKTLGKHLIKGEEIYISISEYETSSEEEKKPEAHRKYIDIQYIFEGEEIIKVASDLGNNKIYSEYDESNDILFYENVENENTLVMTPGSFAVFYPEDIHKPCCNYKGINKVRKAVIKISIDL